MKRLVYLVLKVNIVYNDKIKYKYRVNINKIKYPLKKNQKIGNIEVVYRNKVISNSDIISSDNVERIKFKNLFINNLRYLICGMF